MLFNSLFFFALFMPACLLLLRLAVLHSNGAGVLLLALASLAFYGWTEAHYLPLLLASIAINYLIGRRIMDSRDRSAPGAARGWLVAGLVLDLGCLAYYKYSGLLARLMESAAGTPLGFIAPVLPIGISFFTFTQIAFLVDAYHGKVADRNLPRYLLFVTFFPHLIAGPIIHHASMMPQFAAASLGRMPLHALRAGLAIFLVGLVKKVVIADSCAAFVGPVFDNAMDPRLGSADAWLGVLAYTFQIYFDFSGYSDMAIGLSRMLGVALPENFNSPYRATSIADFWRRWHMSLSAFLRDYLYIPLGGNRRGPVRRYVNLMLTMLLGGLWHGASWTFLVWGGLHGAYLVIQQISQRLFGVMQGAWIWLGRLLTLWAVIQAWVFFRAPDFESAFRLLGLMYGLVDPAEAGRSVDFHRLQALAWVSLAAVLALCCPNTLAWRERVGRWLRSKNLLAARNFTAFTLGVLLAATLLVILMAESASTRSAFIYFSF